MLRGWSIAAAMAVCSAVSVPAYGQDSDGPTAEIDGWSIYQNPSNCRALASFGQDTSLAISLNPAEDEAVLFVEAPEFEEVVHGRGYDFDVTFLTGQSLNSDWSGSHMMGIRQEGMRAVMGSFDGNDFVDDFAAADYIALTRDDEAVVSLHIEAPQDMIKELRRCAARTVKAGH